MDNFYLYSQLKRLMTEEPVPVVIQAGRKFLKVTSVRMDGQPQNPGRLVLCAADRAVHWELVSDYDGELPDPDSQEREAELLRAIEALYPRAPSSDPDPKEESEFVCVTP